MDSDRFPQLPRVVVMPWLPRLGLTRARVRTELRRGNWQMIARGAILTRPDEPTRADWAAVGLAVAGPSAALSGWDALRVRGLGDARPPTRQVLVISRHTSNRVLGQVRIRRTSRPFAASLTSAGATEHPLTPVVTTARALADTALDCRHIAEVRSMLGAAVQKKRCTLRELARELEHAPRNHSALLRQALRETTDGARSAAEAAAAVKLARARRIPAFELNVPVVDEDGRTIYVVDVLWRALRAALEIDSREFHLSDADWKRTFDRHNQLTRYGLAVTHYAPSTVTGRSTAWLDEVADWLARRAADLAVAVPRATGVIAPAPDARPAPLLVCTRPRPS